MPLMRLGYKTTPASILGSPSSSHYPQLSFSQNPCSEGRMGPCWEARVARNWYVWPTAGEDLIPANSQVRALQGEFAPSHALR